MADRQQADEWLTMLGKLNSIVEERLAATHELSECIVEAIREHSQQVVVLRESIDEFRELIEWAVRNDRPSAFGQPCIPAQREPAVEQSEIVVDDAVTLPQAAPSDDQDAAETPQQRKLF